MNIFAKFELYSFLCLGYKRFCDPGLFGRMFFDPLTSKRVHESQLKWTAFFPIYTLNVFPLLSWGGAPVGLSDLPQLRDSNDARQSLKPWFHVKIILKNFRVARNHV